MAFRMRVSTGSAAPIHRQIRDRVCEAVHAGDLQEGDRLPSVRALAEMLVVNPNTVARAYADLARDGVLEGRQGKGVFVARRRPVYTKAERLRRIGEPLDALVNEALFLGIEPAELRGLVDERLGRLEEGGR